MSWCGFVIVGFSSSSNTHNVSYDFILIGYGTTSAGAPFWYYYMAIVNTVVRLTGGFVVAFFQYGSDLDLYRLMVMEGTADVVREGNVVTVDQTDVVPGDIVRLRPGAAYFDMCIIQSKRVLVDER